MQRVKKIALSISILGSISFVLFIHSLVKLSSEPFWDSPKNIYSNFAFVGLELGLPSPYISSAIFLVLQGFLIYGFWYFVLRFFHRRRHRA